MRVRLAVVALFTTAVVVGSLVIRARSDGEPLPSTLDFVAEQERVSEDLHVPPEVRRIGPIYEVSRGPDWSFMAWRAPRGGTCITYATREVTNWSGGCGRLAGRSTDPNAPLYLITLLIDPGERALDRGAIAGAVTPRVHEVQLELTNGRRLRALTWRVDDGALAERFFLIRMGRYERVLTSSDARAFRSYDVNGRLLERFVFSDK